MRSTMPSSPLASGKNLFISLLRRTFILSRTWQKSVRSSTVRLGVFSITSGEPLTTKGTKVHEGSCLMFSFVNLRALGGYRVRKSSLSAVLRAAPVITPNRDSNHCGAFTPNSKYEDEIVS